MEILIISALFLIFSMIIIFFLKPFGKSYNISDILEDFHFIRKEFVKGNKNNKDLEEDLLKSNLNYSFDVDKSKKFVILKINDEEIVNELLKDIPKSSYYDKPYLYFGLYGDDVKHSKPVLEINISPEEITTTTPVKYSFKELSGENIKIKNILWEGNKEYFEKPGRYKVQLKVETSEGIFSDTVEKIIEVNEVKGIKNIYSSNNIVFIVYNNGSVKYRACDKNKLGLPVSDKFADYEIISNVKKMSIKYDHLLVLTYEQKVRSAGSNGFGQLALSNKLDQTNFNDIWGLENIVKVETGYKFSGALTGTKKLFLWGLNEFKQIRFTTNMYYDMPQKFPQFNDVSDFSLGKNHCLVKDSKGKLHSFGGNEFGQLGNGYSDSIYEVQEVLLLEVDIFYAGDEFSMAVTRNGDLYGWGKNNHYQLGLKGARVKKPEIIHPIRDVIYITASETMVAVVNKKGRIFIWGSCLKSSSDDIIYTKAKEVKGASSIKGITITNEKLFVLTKDDDIYASNEEFNLEKIKI